METGGSCEMRDDPDSTRALHAYADNKSSHLPFDLTALMTRHFGGAVSFAHSFRSMDKNVV